MVPMEVSANPMPRPWYEICVTTEGQVRDVEVRGNLEGAKRAIEQLKVDWPHYEMIFMRQHRYAGGFRVLHKLTAHGPRDHTS